MEVAADATVRWCFRPPLDEAPPAVDGEASTPIDRFIRRELEARGIEASPRSQPGPFLRRATFDLTGLPPTPAEIEAFLVDVETRGFEAARDALLDRLLASPAYAERWARRWLDLVRYAETKAHEFDFPIPNAWAYRDYVIRAFDADVPYDRFVTEFLAGDLVESPRLDPSGSFDESVLGTGAWFLGEEVHSPVEPRGDQCDRIAHQVEVISKSVLALGVACARCHDHKFDPISARTSTASPASRCRPQLARCATRPMARIAGSRPSGARSSGPHNHSPARPWRAPCATRRRRSAPGSPPPGRGGRDGSAPGLRRRRGPGRARGAPPRGRQLDAARGRLDRGRQRRRERAEIEALRLGFETLEGESAGLEAEAIAVGAQTQQEIDEAPGAGGVAQTLPDRLRVEATGEAAAFEDARD